MSELEKPWCPCQEELFEWMYPKVPKEDMLYVNGIDRIQRVETENYYEKRRKERRDSQSLSRAPARPSTPRTRRGIKIINKNFPDADFVCPCCEQEYVEEVTIRPAEE